MKKILFSSVSLLLAVATLQAQPEFASVKEDIKKDKQEESISRKDKKEERKELRKLEGREVSYQSKQQFYEDFGNVPDVSWERTKFFDEATFTKDGAPMKAFYDMHAELVGTTTPKTFADLPVAAQKYIQKHYEGYDYGPVLMYDDNEYNETDMLLYGKQFEDEDTYFIEVSKDNKQTILEVTMNGEVGFFKAMP